MRKAAAIVTDSGGMTCHAAIVSRELGIPCVVGTGDATTKLRDGEIVTVNATAAGEGPDVTGGRAAAPPEPAAALEIRPIRPDDKQALLEGFEQLSDESRYRRFLSPRGALSAADLRYLTEVDHHDHEALVAIEPVTGRGVGVARYVRSSTDSDVAELAVAVADDWQCRGVGSRLTEALSDRAREEQIKSFTALVLADNTLMLNLLEDLGSVHDVHREAGTVELIVDLPEHGLGRIAQLIRAVARGDVKPLRINPFGDAR